MSKAKYLTALLCLGLLFVLPSPASLEAAGPPPALTTLQPGGFRNISQNLTINVVFVGYEQGAGAQDIHQAAFLGGLPGTYRPLIRAPWVFGYGIKKYLGLTFTFNYNLVYANSAFENAFFGYLGSIAVPNPRTVFQDLYNAQVNNSLNVSANHWIDGPSVERWLANNAGPMLGVNTQNYTIFFVNWYGRADFKFHVFTKIGEPDPDTGYDFGLIRASRKLIAWGGTAPNDEETGLGSLHRIWFYDLSAGPESWTDNWNVDDADVDGDGVLDYRMPPVWEYGGTAGYRPFTNLSGDLASITRYVAINLLFTTSPLYSPAISPPRLPSHVELDVNLYQAQPGFDAKTMMNVPLTVAEVEELQPFNTFSGELSEVPYVSRAAKVYECFALDATCFGGRLFFIAFADLFLFHQDQLNQFLEGDGDYELPTFLYNVPDALHTCCLGFADDNWRDGTQSFVFGFDSPSARTSGYGLTTTTIHEVGHHLGMSHPHDGYDYEADVDYGPGGPYYYAWSGDESNTMMSYIDVNWDFSQFDRDNMNRYMTSVYINQANAVLAQIYASPRAGQASSLLTSADGHAAAALAAYGAMNYPSAVGEAKMAYTQVMTAAAAIGVKVEPQAYTADYKSKSRNPKFVDTVDYQRSKP